MSWKRILFFLISISIIILPSCSQKHQNSDISSFNENWNFLKPDTTLMSEKYVTGIKDEAWENIILPHTASIEPSEMKNPQWTGVCWYKKTFAVSSDDNGKHIALYFEGAMNDAEIWLNGTKICRHTGGYLPFYLDISEQLVFNSVNTLLIRLDNRDNPLIPPGKPLAGLDFNYYSGIYRNAWLIIKDKLHFTNPLEIDTVSGGGIMVNTEELTAENAIVSVNMSVRNQDNKNRVFKINGTLRNNENIIVQKFLTGELTIGPEKHLRVPVSINVDNPHAWSPGDPYLYTLELTLSEGSKNLETEITQVGIRTIEISSGEGFKINGEKLKIRGTNRHQEYPFIGNALPDNAQYRDAWKIKNAGFNFVRSSHYPQSPAFLDACDELGILVMDAIPGWQFIGDSLFREHSYQDTREMCRRDRNHPSVVLWENSLNETLMPVDFISKINLILRNELPYNGIYTVGWMDTIYSVFMPARQHAGPPDYWTKYAKDKPIFIGEYGDWEYYAQNAGFNQTEFKNLGPAERSSRQLRSAGEIGLLQQAYNYQESHNHNLYGPAIGDANWLMFDYNRGYAPDIESSGIMDIFRLPKFAYWFYKSQSDDEPVCFIASYNTKSSAEYIRVFSNGDSVSLYRNGKFLGTQNPDKNLNTANLTHPPFTFKPHTFEPGTLRAESFKNGTISSVSEVCTAGKPANIKVSADISGREFMAGGSDLIFVYAAITDDKGNINQESNVPVKFNVEGDATLIGQNPVTAEAGIATILLRAGISTGKIKIITESGDLNPGVFEIMAGKQVK